MMLIESPTFQDPLDGNTYRTIRIGSQLWMAENLRSAVYRNGDPVPRVESDLRWGMQTAGAWCYPLNKKEHNRDYGKLYNWLAVNDPRGLAPEGWHIPSDSEWKELEHFLGVAGNLLDITGWRGPRGGGKMKVKDKGNWRSPNLGASNESGFSALPGGYRDVDGCFYVLGSSAYWWTSTPHASHFAWYRSLYYSSEMIHRTHSYERDGFSVRCVKDR